MIILDTNIIAELMRPAPAKTVMTWVDQQESGQLFITTITIAEICYGLNALPLSNRRSSLESNFHQTIVEAFKHRVLAFDESAAHLYGQIMASRKSVSKPMSILDGQIAAIAHAHVMSVATRNIRDFVDCGLNLIDPFN